MPLRPFVAPLMNVRSSFELPHPVSTEISSRRLSGCPKSLIQKHPNWSRTHSCWRKWPFPDQAALQTIVWGGLWGKSQRFGLRRLVPFATSSDELYVHDEGFSQKQRSQCQFDEPRTRLNKEGHTWRRKSGTTFLHLGARPRQTVDEHVD